MTLVMPIIVGVLKEVNQFSFIFILRVCLFFLVVECVGSCEGRF